MFDKTIVLGIAPVKRGFLDLAAAKEQKDKVFKVLSEITPGFVKFVDIDDLCEAGIAANAAVAEAVAEKFTAAGVQALFIPFCDFGEEGAAAGIAARLKLPTLVWGGRDDAPNVPGKRGRDTQCGMFAATKVLSRNRVKFSYIYNEPADSQAFKTGFINFLRTVAVLKDLNGLRVAKFGSRPASFLSVMTNEADLMTRFNITVVPIAPATVVDMAKKMLLEEDLQPPHPMFAPFYNAIRDAKPKVAEYCETLKQRFTTGMQDEQVRLLAALKVALQAQMEMNQCSVAAFECWSAFPALCGLTPCVALGDLAAEGLPLACECDVNGAVTMSILRAANLYEETSFLADLTIRHPENDNAELLWHCGPFSYALKEKNAQASMEMGQGAFPLKQGELTLCRFDDIDGDYVLFAGEGKTTTGPETTNTYVWMEVDNWKRWEEKLMFGPYIHHIGGVYNHILPSLREAARYLDIRFDNAHEQGIHSL